jgi:hypothetical protein
VRAAAVIGHEAPVWLLESVIGRALEPGVLRQLARSDFLLAQPGGVLRFTHGLTRDVIYSMVASRIAARCMAPSRPRIAARCMAPSRPGSPRAAWRHRVPDRRAARPRGGA